MQKARIPILALVALASVSCAQPMPDVSGSVIELRYAISGIVLLTYLFAAGKIADYVQNAGGTLTRREMFLSSFAYMLSASAAVLVYFASPYWAPPQDTLVTKLAYLIAIPLALAAAAGALAILSFFRNRLNLAQAADLSTRIVFAPVFDGLRGYWTMLNTMFVLGIIAAVAFYSSGGNFSLITLDFLILSIAAALYFAYRSISSQNSEDKASNAAAAFILVAPSVLRTFFKDLVCSGLSIVPFGIFSSCPLSQSGGEATLAISVLATLLLLVPVIPVVYAVFVNALRFFSALRLAAMREKRK